MIQLFKFAKKHKADIRTVEESLDKCEQVLLYVLGEVGAKPNVDKWVVQQLLYFADFDCYEKFGESLMGLTYIKSHRGPLATKLDILITDMVAQEKITKVEFEDCEIAPQKYLALQTPDLSILSAQEIKQVDYVLAWHSNKTAKEIERHSMGDIPCRVAQDWKPLEYEHVFYRGVPYSVGDYDEL